MPLVYLFIFVCFSAKPKPQPSRVTSQVQPGPNRMVTIHIKKTLPGNRKRGVENVGGPQKKNQTFDFGVLWMRGDFQIFHLVLTKLFI